MSRAFVRESDTESVEPLPDRPVSAHPNLVTPTGLELIEARVRELEAARGAAQSDADRQVLAGIDRDLRYWRARRGSAQVVSVTAAPEIVRFGVTVELRFEDDSVRRFQIVGEDEADPVRGTLSWTSPVAAALIGHHRGDVVQLAGREAEIVGLRA